MAQGNQPFQTYAIVTSDAAIEAATESANAIVFNDHPVFRSNLAWKMEVNSGVRVIADVAALFDTLALAADLAPDAILADMRIGDGNSEGIESVTTLARKLGGIPVIVNSDFCSRANVARMIEAGAAAVVSKSAGAETLVKAILDAVARSRSTAENSSHSAA